MVKKSLQSSFFFFLLLLTWVHLYKDGNVYIKYEPKSSFWVVPFTFYGSQYCLAPKCSLLKITILGGSLHLLWFPELFGLKVLPVQNEHFGWFPQFSMLPSVVWLQYVFHSKSTFWVVSFTFYGSQYFLASKVLSAQNHHFEWFPSLVMVLSVVWLLGAFCIKMNILGGSLHFLWFPVLFVSNMLSTQNQHFGWFLF